MEESALERYFEKFIADGASNTKEEEKKRSEELEEEEEEFLKLLPDELLLLGESGLDQDQRESGLDQRESSLDQRESGLDPDSRPRRPDSPGPELVPMIKNITSTVNLSCRLDLNFIAANALNVKFNNKRFNGLSIQIRKPRATGIFYSSGKLVCVGADSVERSKVAARRLARIVQKLGFPVRFLNFQINNLVASCRTHAISLERMGACAGCSFEPELFGGLFYSVAPGMTMLVFRSGILALTGAKSQADIDSAFEIARPVLNFYRK